MKTNRPFVFMLGVVAMLFQMKAGAAVEKIAYRGWQNCYRLSNDSVEVVVVPESGGRISEYSLKGKNIMYVDPRQDGKTLKDYRKQWFDPDGGRFDYGPERVTQRIHEVTWMGPWKATVTGEYSLRIVSQPDPSLGLESTREFTLDKESSHLVVRQTMRNVSDHETKWWFWSRTLAKPGGKMLAPLNSNSKLPKGWGKYVWKENRVEIENPQDNRIAIVDGIITLHAVGPAAGFGTDASAGWMAYGEDGLLFIKRFRYFPNKAYKEDAGFTTRLYMDGEKCELEPVSPQVILQPNESYSFTEHWWLFDYPPANELDFDCKAAAEFIHAHTLSPARPGT